MNRREAIAALTALPGVAAIKQAAIEPGAVIVVECDDRHISEAAAHNIRRQVEAIWPGHKVVVCPGDVRIKVVQG